jgi:acetoin utilization deacetylase AcuC-like enzyme
MGQKVQAFVGREAGQEEGPLFGGGESGGHDAVEALGRQSVEAAAYETGRRRRAFGYRRQIGQTRVTAPWGDPRPFGPPLDDGWIACAHQGKCEDKRRAPSEGGRRSYRVPVSILVETHPQYLAHDTGSGHPERPARLEAVLAGLEAAGLGDALTWAEPRPATRAELERVHPAAHLDALEAFCRGGGGRIDTDTSASAGSWDAALLAAGAGLDAVDRLEAGEATAAFCAVRPPGHHATPTRAMGFCLLNNVAVTAAALADRGERVLVYDWDAHHGNGTQDTFYRDARVLYISAHQWPLYPGTGALDETGDGAGDGATINLPFPPGTTGDVYLAAFDEVIAPAIEAFVPTWTIVSAGFDAHRADPLTGLDLAAGDYADLTARLLGAVPPGRVVAFLEGGYDLQALALSAGAFVAALAGLPFRPEPATSGGPGRAVVDAAFRLRSDLPM